MLLKNALIVAEGGEFTGDLRCEGGLFAELGQDFEPRPGEEALDLTGKIVFPGGVDVHTHMDLDVGIARATDDFHTGTGAAACGGTTTIVDHMAFGAKGFTISSQLERYHALANGKAVIDYGFHGVLDHVDENILNEVESLAAEGVTSHKFYLTYDGRISDAEAFALMRAAKRLGVMLCVHPENHGVIALLRREFVAAGKRSPEYHALSRPPECEAEAIGRMAMLASAAGGSPLYVVHLTCALGLGLVAAARRRGQAVFAETCPQYLLLDGSRYLQPDALKYVMSPPLRKKADNAALWEGLASGDIQAIGTDHCPFFYAKEKQMGKDDFTKTPNGAPGVEARMALMFSEGVQKGRITLRQMAELCCAAPARLFGLYPRKGAIRPGADADFTVFDPARKLTLTKALLHENCDYTPYEGFALTGWPVLTASRGEIVARDGVFTGQKGRGHYLKRGLPMLA
jgi:dihydropyrimidinase